jgi:hypothetical protein
MTNTYTEKVLRYRVARREVITDPRRRAELQINGLDPDNIWSLIWSFDNLKDAEDQAEDERNIFKAPNWEVKVVDAGKTEYIERSIW